MSESSARSHISCTRAQTCAVLHVTLVGAVCYLSGSVPSACLPTLHKPSNATLLGLLQLWPAAQWKKRGRDKKERRSAEKVTCGQLVSRADIRTWVTLNTSLTLTLEPYPYSCCHIPYLLHIRVKQITWNNERLNFDLVLLTGQNPVIHNCYNRVFPQTYVITSAHLLHMRPTSVPNPDSFQALGWASNIPNEAADIKQSRRGNEKHLFCSHKCNKELFTSPSHGWRPHNFCGERVLWAFLEKRLQTAHSPRHRWIYWPAASGIILNGHCVKVKADII